MEGKTMHFIRDIAQKMPLLSPQIDIGSGEPRITVKKQSM